MTAIKGVTQTFDVELQGHMIGLVISDDSGYWVNDLAFVGSLSPDAAFKLGARLVAKAEELQQVYDDLSDAVPDPIVDEKTVPIVAPNSFKFDITDVQWPLTAEWPGITKATCCNSLGW